METQNNQPATEVKPTEKEVMTGGPHENQAPQGTEPEKKTGETVFEVAGGRFKTPEELAEYTRALEGKHAQVLSTTQARQEMPSNQPNPTNQGNQTQSWVDEVEEEISVNPKSAIAKLRQGIQSDIDNASAKARNEQKFWEEFYDENQDLKNLKPIVQSVISQKRDELSPLKVGDAKKFIANETRKMVNLVKEQSGIKREEMPEGGAAFVNGGGKAPAPKGTAQPIPNFVDQVRQWQKRG